MIFTLGLWVTYLISRRGPDYTWSSLQKVVPEALDSVPLITIRKYAWKSWRYMDIYRKGITGKMAEFAAKSISLIVMYPIQFNEITK